MRSDSGPAGPQQDAAAEVLGALVQTSYAVVDAVDTRSRMMDAGLDDMRANVVDEYVAIRDAYRQSRRMAVADGQIDEDAQLNSLTPLSFDDEEAEDDAEDAGQIGMEGVQE